LTTKMAIGIPSVFAAPGIGPIEEEADEGSYWITVCLTPEMSRTHTDVEIMEFVANTIRNRRAKLSDCSLYRPGNRCISFATAQWLDDNMLWYDAETVALHILTEMELGNLTLSRGLLFGSSNSR
jgi:hypothetical protein